ncbi:MAG TPA: sulfotransferase [Solirubrobacteraceae bacterium]
MAQPAPARPQVVYVMGSGHSGSTILGLTLGNCDGFVYAGELDNWLTRSGTSVLGGTERTRFWSEVRKRVANPEELFGTASQTHLERASAALRPESYGVRRKLRGEWARVTTQLYEALANVSDAPYVIDTAHFPLRARELKRLDGIDLHLIFLVRDPEQVVHSFTRFMNRHALAERFARVLSKNLDIWLTHVLSLGVFLRTPRTRRLFVRHEDFLAEPERVLQAILDLAGSPAATPDLASLRTGFPIQANRLIASASVSLVSKPHAKPRWGLTRLLQLPWEPIFARLRPRAGGDG